MRTHRALVAVVFAFGVAACGENASAVTTPETAAYNTGHTFGGGNKSDTTTTTTTTAATSGEGTAVDGNGHTLGGGN
jgi:hypothetical protein